MHREALTESAAALFDLLPSFPDFYLAGGTALALQLGHRVSADFGLFTDEVLSPQLDGQVGGVFRSYRIAPSVHTRDEFTAFIGSVKITFLFYPFPLVERKVDLGGVPAASVAEIAAMKAYTIGRRATFKDYVDLHAILAGGQVRLMAIIDLANKKFGSEFNDRLFLEQLILLEDIVEEPIQFLGAVVRKGDIQSFMEKQVRGLVL